MWEMLSGRNPFQRGSTIETLHATLKEEPPDLDADLKVPPALAQMLDTCLAKDPAARFHSAHDLAFALRTLDPSLHPSGTGPFPEVRRHWRWRKVLAAASAALAVGALAVGAAIWRPWRPASPPYDPRCVALLPFENRTGDPSLDPLGQQVVELLRQDLQPVEDLRVAPDVPATGPSAPRRVAEATRARFVAGGSYYLRGPELEFLARLEDPWTGRVVYQLGPWQGPRQDPGPALAELRQRLGGAIAWTYEKAIRYAPGAVRPPRLEALQVYLKVMNEFTATPTRDLIPRFEQAAALDPDFFPLRLDTFDAFLSPSVKRMDRAAEQVAAMEARDVRTPVERTLARMARAQLEGWREEQVKACADLNELMPGTIWVQLRLALTLAALNRPGRAIPLLQRLPDDWFGRDAAIAPQPTQTLCWAYHLQGDYASERMTARAAQIRFAGETSFQRLEAEALVGLHRVDEAERLIQSLGTTTPGRGGADGPGIAQLWTMLELRVHGYPERARRFAEQRRTALLGAPPATRKANRTRLAQALLCLDRTEEALAVFRDLSAETPDGVLYRGEVGATLARLGRAEEARGVEAELAALTRPYLRGDPTFWRACIAAQLGEKDRAVALLRQAFAQGRVRDWFGDTHREFFLEPLRGYPPYDDLMRPRD
jgi:TolB-like protein